MAMEYNPIDWDEALLINGDDCVFEACPRAFEQWTVFGESFGLSPSPGKVDYSVGRLQMNSRVFCYGKSPYSSYCVSQFDYTNDIWVERPRFWHYVPVMMMGLASAMKRSEGYENSNEFEGMDYETSWKDFSHNLRGLDLDTMVRMRGEYDKLYIPAILNKFKGLRDEFYESYQEDWSQRIHWNSGDLRRKCNKNISYNLLQRVPFNLPARFGGLGLPGLPSVYDLRTAWYMHRRGLTNRPCGGKQWLFHDLLRSDLNAVCEPRVLSEFEESNLGPLYWTSFVNHREKNFIGEDDIVLEPERWLNRAKRFVKYSAASRRKKFRIDRTPLDIPPVLKNKLGWRVSSCKSSCQYFSLLHHLM